MPGTMDIRTKPLDKRKEYFFIKTLNISDNIAPSAGSLISSLTPPGSMTLAMFTWDI